MDVSLSPELEWKIAREVRSGRYASVSEAVEQGLRLLLETEGEREQRLAAMRAQIVLGLEELDRGEGIPGDRVMAEIKELIEAARAK